MAYASQNSSIAALLEQRQRLASELQACGPHARAANAIIKKLGNR